MVKNTKGGKCAKSMARKTSSGDGGFRTLPLSTCEFEKYGFVSKIFGNCMCQILFSDGSSLIGHIRGKFRGRSKRNNIIKPNDVVLVGLRDMESPPKNCDIMYIYDDNEVRILQENPALNINKLLENDPTKNSTITSHDVLFTNEIEEENEIEQLGDFKLASVAEIDFDDI
jgi:initiation factor 1A